MKNKQFSLTIFVLFLIATVIITNVDSNENKNLSNNSNSNKNNSQSNSTNKSTTTTSTKNTNKEKTNLNVFFKSSMNIEGLKVRSKNRNKTKLHQKIKNPVGKRLEGEVERLKKISFKKKISKNTQEKEKDAKKEEPKPKPAALIPTDKNKLVNHEKFKVVMEDWMKISSSQFTDVNYYPNILMPDYEVRNIHKDDYNYRINPLYKKKIYGDPNYPPSRYSFYFRYTDKNIYYTADKNSLKILGNISIKEIKDIKESSDPDYSDCLVIESFSLKWNICNEDLVIKHKWFCNIKYDLGMDVESCKQLILENIQPTIIEKKITQPIILIPSPALDCNDSWNYAKWGEDWECDCSDGREQSPIDIPGVKSGKVVISPVKPVFYYLEAPQSITQNSRDGFYAKGDSVKITYTNGYISLKHPLFGTAVTLDGVVYNAEEVRFHTPSEHTIDGKQFDMEIEVIHYGTTKGDLSKQLIFNILIEKYPGVYNKFIDDLDMFNLPNPLNPVKNLKANLHLNKLLYNSDEDGYLNMKYFDFFTYMGSLTSPPCTEQTIHIVTANPIKLGTTALSLFKEAIRVPDVVDSLGNVIVNTKKEWSNRKTQPLNGRKVYFYKTPYKYDEIGKAQVAEKPSDGHYEKITKTYTSFYKVTTDQPSGMPGSFVVSENEALGKKNE